MAWEDIGSLLTELREQKPQSGQCDDGMFYDMVCRVLECQTERIATQQEQIDQNTTDIQLGGGGSGATAQECGNLNNGVTSLDLSTYDQCNTSSGFTVSMSGTNNDDNAGANASVVGDVVFFCDGVEIERQPFSLVDSNIGNGEDYGDTATFNIPTGSCAGVMTSDVEINSQSLPNGGTFSAAGCLSASCTI